MTGEKEAIARAIYERRNGYGCKPWSLLTKAHKEPYLGDAEAVLALFAPILAEKERLRRELHSLAVALHRKHYWHVKQWKPFDDALGLATQIDNMTAGLVPQARALAAEAALAAERERIAASLDAQADALWERCETKRSEPPSIDEQADAAQAFALQKAAAAIRAQGE